MFQLYNVPSFSWDWILTSLAIIKNKFFSKQSIKLLPAGKMSYSIYSVKGNSITVQKLIDTFKTQQISPQIKLSNKFSTNHFHVTFQMIWSLLVTSDGLDGICISDVWERRSYLPTVKDCNPVMARPRIRAWMSWVPGGWHNTGVIHVEVVHRWLVLGINGFSYKAIH